MHASPDGSDFEPGKVPIKDCRRMPHTGRTYFVELSHSDTIILLIQEVPMPDQKPDWTLCVLEDLQAFFMANDMDRSAAAMSNASRLVSKEIKKMEEGDFHWLTEPDRNAPRH